MSHLLDDDDDAPRHRGDREVTLSTGAILGIFFGLTLICGFFFAFGYNMGHKASPALAATAGDASDTYTSASAAYSSSPKPSAGSPLGQPSITPSSNVADIAGVPPHSVATTPKAAATEQPTSLQKAVVEETQKAAPTPAPAPARIPATSSGGTFVVQVAAVSHQEDAELLVSSLQKKGYSVAARNEPGDKLVHVQVGPFADHKDADAMKERLQGDGFHALIKQL